MLLGFGRLVQSEAYCIEFEVRCRVGCPSQRISALTALRAWGARRSAFEVNLCSRSDLGNRSQTGP